MCGTNLFLGPNKALEPDKDVSAGRFWLEFLVLPVPFIELNVLYYNPFEAAMEALEPDKDVSAGRFWVEFLVLPMIGLK